MISIVINTFNRKNDLLVAIKSVKEQIFKSIEIIVVDDCSSDGTDEIDFDSLNVRYIKNSQNLGLPRSRQIGLNEASYELVAFLDDDDYFSDKKKLEIQLSHIQADENIAVVCTSVTEFDGVKEPHDKIIQWPDDLKAHFLNRNGVIYPSTTLIRRSAFLNVGGFDARFSRGIDSDVYRRLIFSGYKIAFIPEPMVYYRINRNDKITDNVTKSGLKKDILNNYFTIKKYWVEYIKSPLSLIKKVWLMSKKVILFYIRK
jgi:glycosyltransferase involved in cell wall biosynthesis